MKKTINHSALIILLIIVVIVTIASCKKFLDAAPQGQISEDAISSDPAAAETLVTGVYNGLWDGQVHGFDYVSATNIASDDADKGSTPADGANSHGLLDNLTTDPSVGIINNIWSGHFRAIARANQALGKIPLSPAGQGTKNRLEAEVKFLRAYLYFNL